MGREIRCLLRRDLILGFFSIRYRLFIAYFILMLLLFVNIQMLTSNIRGIDNSSFSYIDLLVALFQGVEFAIIENHDFEFPYAWLVLQAIVPFLIGGYVREDFYNQTSFLFVRVRHRLSLWISKLLFSFIVVIFLYAFFFVLSYLAASIFISPSFTKLTYFSLSENVQISPVMVIQFMMIPFGTGMMIATVQSVLSVFLKPVYSFIILISLFIISVYSENALLPGSYSMLLRYEYFDAVRGLSFSQFGIYVSIVITVFGVVGFYLFKKMDIMQKERGTEDD